LIKIDENSVFSWGLVAWLLGLSFAFGGLWNEVKADTDYLRIVFAQLNDINKRLARIEGKLDANQRDSLP
jgi:hypothetical protein